MGLKVVKISEIVPDVKKHFGEIVTERAVEDIVHKLEGYCRACGLEFVQIIPASNLFIYRELNK